MKIDVVTKIVLKYCFQERNEKNGIKIVFKLTTKTKRPCLQLYGRLFFYFLKRNVYLDYKKNQLATFNFIE